MPKTEKGKELTAQRQLKDREKILIGYIQEDIKHIISKQNEVNSGLGGVMRSNTTQEDVERLKGSFDSKYYIREKGFKYDEVVDFKENVQQLNEILQTLKVLGTRYIWRSNANT